MLTGVLRSAAAVLAVTLGVRLLDRDKNVSEIRSAPARSAKSP